MKRQKPLLAIAETFGQITCAGQETLAQRRTFQREEHFMERYRFYSGGAVFFVTFSVVDWLPVFVAEPACRIICESLNYCHDQKNLRINAYVIMPTHFHAIVFDSAYDPKRLELTLIDFRKFTGRRLADFCVEHLPKCFSDTLRQCAGEDRERRFWQSSRHPVQIESETFWQTRFDYLHENPCRKGLVRRAVDWRFSSAGFWFTEGKLTSDVKLSGILW